MNDIQKLVSKNHLREALNLLLSYEGINKTDQNKIVILSGQLNEIIKNELLKIRTLESISIEKNRIRKAILLYGDKYGNEIYNLNKDSDFNIEKFIGMGNEPGWSLRISNQNIIFSTNYGEITNAYEITEKFQDTIFGISDLTNQFQ